MTTWLEGVFSHACCVLFKNFTSRATKDMLLKKLPLARPLAGKVFLCYSEKCRRVTSVKKYEIVHAGLVQNTKKCLSPVSEKVETYPI